MSKPISYHYYRFKRSLARYAVTSNVRTRIGALLWLVIIVATGVVGRYEPVFARMSATTTLTQAHKLSNSVRINPWSLNKSPASQPNGPAPRQFYPNNYDRGNCTYYVASRRAIPPHWGDANNWYRSALSSGWAVGTIPRVGAIAWTSSGTHGHVAVVEAISEASVEVAEMNFIGFNLVDRRWASASDFRYIY